MGELMIMRVFVSGNYCRQIQHYNGVCELSTLMCVWVLHLFARWPTSHSQGTFLQSLIHTARFMGYTLVLAFLALVSQATKMSFCISVTICMPFSGFWMLVPLKHLFNLTEVSCCDFKHVTFQTFKYSRVSLCISIFQFCSNRSRYGQM